jgi:hypothetical protein
VRKLKIPIPDPLGILEKATEDEPIQFWDPLAERVFYRKVEPTPELKEFVEKHEENIDKAIEHIKKAAENLECDFCKGLNVNLSEYLMKYNTIRKLEDKGYTLDEAKKIYEEKYADEVRHKVEKMQKDLKIKDHSITKSKAKFGEVLSRSLRGD